VKLFVKRLKNSRRYLGSAVAVNKRKAAVSFYAADISAFITDVCVTTKLERFGCTVHFGFLPTSQWALVKGFYSVARWASASEILPFLCSISIQSTKAQRVSVQYIFPFPL